MTVSSVLTNSRKAAQVRPPEIDCTARHSLLSEMDFHVIDGGGDLNLFKQGYLASLWTTGPASGWNCQRDYPQREIHVPRTLHWVPVAYQQIAPDKKLTDFVKIFEKMNYCDDNIISSYDIYSPNYYKFIVDGAENIGEQVAVDDPELKALGPDLIFALREFGDLEAGWDGEQALKPSAASIDDAAKFLTMAPSLWGRVSPYPHVDGTILLELDGGASGAIEFCGDGHFIVAVATLPPARTPLGTENVRRVVEALAE